MSSERSAAHHYIDGKGRRLEYRSGQTLPAPGYMCISMYTYRVEPYGQETETSTVATRLLTHAFLPNWNEILSFG